MTNPWKLPPRQAEILHLLVTDAAGCNKTAARILGIDAHTVEEHLRRSFKKMEVRNRIQAVLKWDRWMREKQE